MKSVKSYPTTVEADIARIALEAAGVPAVVIGTGVGMKGGVAGVQPLVPGDRIEEAMTVLGSGAILGFILGVQGHRAGRWICSACQTGALQAAELLHDCPVPDSQVTPDALFLMTTAALGGKVLQVTPELKAATAQKRSCCRPTRPLRL